ncbi:MAG TPA: thioesterase domain-containing protein, partial [Burkholderiales bacterium]|nr:thioesterase domain-containing protein [Burkholderiales bacterium]
MSIAAFLSDLRRNDIHVWLDGETLRCDARAGALNEATRAELRERKSEIIGFLNLSESLARQPDAIVPIQPHGFERPIFGVPPHTGDVFAYRAFAHALGPEHPFFGLQPPGVDTSAPPIESVDALAKYFAEQIRTFQPRAPWIIAGYCMGGTVAYELAQQLSGGRSDAVVLLFFGVPYPSFFGPASLFRHQLGNRAKGWRQRMRLLLAQSGRERMDYVKWRIALIHQTPDEATQRRSRLEAATLNAVRAYAPRPFGGRVCHFIPCQTWARRSRARTERWRALVPRIEAYYGPEGATADDMLLGAHADA